MQDARSRGRSFAPISGHAALGRFLPARLMASAAVAAAVCTLVACGGSDDDSRAAEQAAVVAQGRQIDAAIGPRHVGERRLVDPHERRARGNGAVAGQRDHGSGWRFQFECPAHGEHGIAKAFGLRVIGVKRNPADGGGAADSLHGLGELRELLPHADYVALTCPLNAETAKIVNTEALSQMKRSAYLINVARGGCVDEDALIAALRSRAIAGAAVDVTAEEPLSATSPLWDMRNVLITPHTAGETQKYEDNVLDILVENLDRLRRGESTLRNEIV